MTIGYKFVSSSISCIQFPEVTQGRTFICEKVKITIKFNMFDSCQQFIPNYSTIMRTSKGIFKEEHIRETRRMNILSPKMSIRRPYSIHPKSPTGSISSSSSWSSSQESLNIYGSSPESPRLSGLRPQDRLRRIRESFNWQQSNKMEIDEGPDCNSVIHPMKQSTETCSTSHHYSPMIPHDDVTKSVRSASLRLKRFRQARTESIPINRDNNNEHGYPSFHPWERKTPSSNKRCYPNERCESNTEKSLSNEYQIPQWMMPILSMKPLRRPYIAQRQI